MATRSYRVVPGIASQTMPEVAANFDQLELRIRAANAPDVAKGLAGAFTVFARSAVTDFKNVGQSAEQLAKKLQEVILNAILFKPLEQQFTSLFSGFGGGSGGLLSSIGSWFGGSSAPTNILPTSGWIHHDGGLAGQGQADSDAPCSA